MPGTKDHLPVNLYSAEQVRELDRIAIEDLGILGYTLMTRAGEYSYACLKNHWPEAKSIAVICAGGNNAGDGYVIAGLAREDGKQVTVFYLIDPAELKGDAVTAYKYLHACNIEPVPFSADALKGFDVIVDAVFGTGLDRDVKGQYYDAIKAINSSRSQVLSVDIPSGLNADTGHVMNIAVKANLTPTFIGLKKGMFTGDGLEYSGTIKFNDLDVPKETYQRLHESSARRLRLEDMNTVLRPRKRNSHKGNFGHVLVVGGDSGYLGAARMAAEAAGRVGAGLVSIATRAAHASVLSLVRPEIMSHGVETLDELTHLIHHADVIAIGPGLGQSKWAKQLFAHVLKSELPLVIDADALNLLAKDHLCSKDWVITPHPGEASRLLNTDAKTIQFNRFQTMIDLKVNFPGPVVLKGSGTLVADCDGHVFVCDAGNPGMASGGMGDVLTGVIAGLIAQGIEINLATKLGVCLHANAADRAAANSGERGLLALDLMPHLRSLVNP